ncbi:MAG: hypothetical protein WAN12_15590 [Candidatus Acidiferrum sp.]
MDLFTPIAPAEKIHKSFEYVRTSESHQASRVLLQKIFDSLPGPDGNFVLDFQTTGFDARIWELYLSALFNNLGIRVSRPNDRPDFLLEHNGTKVWVEATTANPAQNAADPVVENLQHWPEQEEIAIKLGSALYSKVKKEYWKLPHVQGMPLVLAIADFHKDDPMRHSSAPLERYLYGLHVKLGGAPDDPRANYELHPIEKHSLGKKSIPTGFFSQPNVENISAILFSNAGTVPKFNRMGLQLGTAPNVKALRFGLAYSPNPDAVMPEPFWYVVGDRNERWEEEAILFHNPNALNPLPEDLFGDVIEVFSADGDYYHKLHGFHPVTSLTQTLVFKPDEAEAMDFLLRLQATSWMNAVTERQPEMEGEVRAIHAQWPTEPGQG